MSDAAVEVAVPLPVRGSFHYDPSGRELAVGTRVLVPFGRRSVVGIVLGRTEPPADTALRPIREILDREPAVPPDVLRLARFVADYYLAPLGEVLKVALPPVLTRAPDPRWVTTPRGQAILQAYDGDGFTGEILGPRERRLLAAAAAATGLRPKTSDHTTLRRLAERE